MDFEFNLTTEQTTTLIIVLGILLLAFLVGWIIRKLLVNRAELDYVASNPLVHSFIMSIAHSVTLFSFAIAFALLVKYIEIPDRLNSSLSIFSRSIMTMAFGIWLYYLVEIPGLWFEHLTNRNSSSTGQMIAPIIKRTLQVIVIVLILAQLFHIISNKPITPIIAGFGIGGVAVALAAQDTFKHFFGSFVIAGDKPFEIGERIKVGGVDGIVEGIGIRSTRLRTLENHWITYPNGVLANMTIENVTKREYLKRVFYLSLTYNTPPEKMEEATKILKELLRDHEGMNPEFPPRIHFKEFGSHSLDIGIFYWYHSSDYWEYMDFSDKLNFQILRRFNEAGLEFAFPTQTLYIAENHNNKEGDNNKMSSSV